MTRIALRRIGVTAAALILVLLAALTAVRVHGSMILDPAVERFEEAVGPLRFEAYRPAPVADAENAARPILEAVERLEERADEGSWRDDVGRLQRLNRLAAGDWSPEDVERARQAVDARPRVLALLHRAAGRSGSSFGLDYSAGPEMEIPNLLLTLKGGHLLFAEARLAWLDGAAEEGVRAVEALATLSHALQTEAPLIFQLVGQTVEVLQYRAIQDGLAMGGLGPQTLRRLRASTRDRDRAEMLRLSLGIEGSMVHSVRRGGRFAEALARSQTFYGRLEHRVLGDAAVARGLEYYARVAEALPELSYAEMLDRPELLAKPEDDGTGLVVRLGSSVGTFQATEALERLARLALELALEAADQGSYPAELLPAPAAGPEPFTGEAPVYEPSPGGASATLFIPGADELWRGVKPERVRSGDEAEWFRWRLAPPAA